MPARSMTPADRDAVGAIQQLSPSASQWDPLEYSTTVWEEEGRVVAFLTVRQVAPDEREILNLAVHPAFRRRGIARRLVAAQPPSVWFLEVRESNQPARKFYNSLGFQEITRRKQYYADPTEDAIVMRR